MLPTPSGALAAIKSTALVDADCISGGDGRDTFWVSPFISTSHQGPLVRLPHYSGGQHRSARMRLSQCGSLALGRHDPLATFAWPQYRPAEARLTPHCPPKFNKS